MRKTLILLVILLAGGVLTAHAQTVPATPTSFTANPISACAIELSWSQPSTEGAHFYTYYQSTNNFSLPANGYSTRIPGVGNLPNAPVTGEQKIKVTQYRSTPLLANSEYWYKLASCNENGCSEKVSSGNQSVRTRTLPQTPGKPTITKVTVTEDTGTNATTEYIDLEWSAVSGLNSFGGYIIYQSTNGGAYQYLGFSPLYSKDALGETTYSRGVEALKYRITNLPSNANYSFHVKSYDSDFNCITGSPIAVGNQTVLSVQSNAVEISKKPGNPTLPPPAQTSIEEIRFNLPWDSVSESTTFFQIQRSTNANFSGGNPIKTSEAARGTEAFIDTEIDPNTVYYYRFRACTAPNICSVFTPTLAASAGLVKPVLYAPRVLFANENSERGRVMLTWEEVVGATSYKIFRGTSPDPSEMVETQSSDEYETLPLGTKYYYQIKAIKGTEESISDIEEVNLDIKYFLRGSAWSGAGSIETGAKGPGWINFRDIRTLLGNRYSVQIDGDGNLSGLAWAGSKYGWLSFNKADLVGCPTAPCEAKMNITTGNLSGWARFYARSVDRSVGAWTGWLKLSGPNYGVHYDNARDKFLGQAWGGDVVGWVAMNRRDSCKKVVQNEEDCDTRLATILKEWNVRATDITEKPVLTNLLVVVGPEGVEWCAETPYYKVSWVYTGNTPQTEAEVKFIEVNGDGTKDYTHTVTGNATTSILNDPLSVLSSSTAYRVQVKAYDGERWSDPVVTPNLTTPISYYPLIDFSWDDTPAVNTLTVLTSHVEDRSNTTPPPVLEYSWDIEDGTFTGSANESTISVIFNSLPSDLTLIVSDVNGDGCAITREVTGTGGGGGGGNGGGGSCTDEDPSCFREVIDEDDLTNSDDSTSTTRRRRIRER